MGGLLVWGGLLAFDWGRSAHPHSDHLWWSGQVLFLLLVAILVVALVGTISEPR